MRTPIVVVLALTVSALGACSGDDEGSSRRQYLTGDFSGDYYTPPGDEFVGGDFVYPQGDWVPSGDWEFDGDWIPSAGDNETAAAPEAANCIATTGGTVTATITGSEPTFNGYPYVLYCFDLAIGESVTIGTSAATEVDLLSDTVLWLYDTTPTLVAQDDDGGSGGYSLLTLGPVSVAGSYMVAVTGFSTSDTGSFVLSIEIL